MAVDLLQITTGGGKGYNLNAQRRRSSVENIDLFLQGFNYTDREKYFEITLSPCHKRMLGASVQRLKK